MRNGSTLRNSTWGRAFVGVYRQLRWCVGWGELLAALSWQNLPCMCCMHGLHDGHGLAQCTECAIMCGLRSKLCLGAKKSHRGKAMLCYTYCCQKLHAEMATMKQAQATNDNWLMWPLG